MYLGAGLEILAFPCNQFGDEEPGSNDQITEFVCTHFKSEFQIFEKVDMENLHIFFLTPLNWLFSVVNFMPHENGWPFFKKEKNKKKTLHFVSEWYSTEFW